MDTAAVPAAANFAVRFGNNRYLIGARSWESTTDFRINLGSAFPEAGIDRVSYFATPAVFQTAAGDPTPAFIDYPLHAG